MKNYHKVIPAVYLILVKDKKVLLQRRFNTGYEDGNYSLPGGHIEKREHATLAAIREAKEELGIDVQEESLELVHTMHRLSNGQERLDLAFLITEWSNEPQNVEPEKADNLAWFNINKLPDNTISCIYHVINCFKEKISYSEYGWEEK